MNITTTPQDQARREWLHTWTWMTEWERHCHRTGGDPDDLDAMNDFNEAMYEESLYGRDY